jgi:dipeptidyl aminopeptidase/acylaminoacyl peptidase
VAALPGLYDAIGGTPEEAPQEYRKRSALYQARRITCPVLVIHGMDDPIVPVEQAYLLKDELAGAGIPCESLIIPDATHGIFTGRSKNETGSGAWDPLSHLVWQRIDEFLDRHLLTECR